MEMLKMYIYKIEKKYKNYTTGYYVVAEEPLSYGDFKALLPNENLKWENITTVSGFNDQIRAIQNGSLKTFNKDDIQKAKNG